MDYPVGKSMKLPNGSLSMYVPGHGKITNNRGAMRRETSAYHCGDEMSILVPGCKIGEIDYKHYE